MGRGVLAEEFGSDIMRTLRLQVEEGIGVLAKWFRSQSIFKAEPLLKRLPSLKVVNTVLAVLEKMKMAIKPR